MKFEYSSGRIGIANEMIKLVQIADGIANFVEVRVYMLVEMINEISATQRNSLNKSPSKPWRREEVRPPNDTFCNESAGPVILLRPRNYAFYNSTALEKGRPRSLGDALGNADVSEKKAREAVYRFFGLW